MLARIWRGSTAASKADDYLKYMNKTVVQEYRATQGNRGVYLLRRIDGSKAEFLLLSLWESRDAIKTFAGPEIDKAKYYPEDKSFLVDLESTVTHYELLAGPEAAGAA